MATNRAARVLVRRATLADVPAVTPLFDAYRQFYLQASDPSTCERFLVERLRNNESVVFVATLAETHDELPDLPAASNAAAEAPAATTTTTTTTTPDAAGGPVIAAGEAAGFCQLYPLFSSISARRLWLLNDLFVAPESRRHGVANALMAVAETFARDEGGHEIMLQTAETNIPGQKLYESRGWEKELGYRTYLLTLDQKKQPDGGGGGGAGGEGDRDRAP
jgi:ribosomal protein S18 acetylase RimI-like enzyme